MTDTRLTITDPETGEMVNLDTLDDRELDELHLHLSAMRREYARLDEFVWDVLRQRAIKQGGLDGSVRRWTVERRSYQTARPEFKREVSGL